jgi:RND family efflux transporter MFP subunit
MTKSNPLWIILLGTILFISCGEEEPEKEIIRPVRYMQAYSTGGSRVRAFTGVAQAGMESNLSFKVPGTVQKVAVLVGDDVKRGQLIAALDPNDYSLQVQQAEAALAQARAEARNASSNFERVRALYESNNISKSSYDAARAANESAKAAVRSAEKQFEMAQLKLSYTRLTAPVSGAIASCIIEVNENVQAGSPVVMLTSGSQIEVKILIPGILISQVKEGGKVTVTFDAIPKKEFAATILEVGVAATGVGTTFPVTVLLDEKDAEIRSGMAATVACRFESRDERERFILPSHAVVEDREGRFVYVVEPIPDEIGYGTIHRKSVTVGDLTAGGIEIFEGISDGDLVVTAGVSRIIDGQKVKIQNIL